MISIPEIFPLVPHLDEGKLKIKVDDLEVIPDRNRNKVISLKQTDILNRTKWSLLLAHYEFNHKGINPEIIEFAECGNRVLNIRCKYIMRFTEPFEVANGYYLIPGFPGFVINEIGVVKTLRGDRALKTGDGPYGYPQVALYDPDKCRWRNVAIHILMARTFLHNDEPWSKPFVNHIDGNKINFSLKNLEWVSAKENVEHAQENNLSTDSMACKLKDHLTGEVHFFSSRSEAGRWMNHHGTPHTLYFQAGGSVFPKLFKKRFELRDQSDTTDWYYTTQERRDSIIASVPPFQMRNITTEEVVTSDSISHLSRISSVDRSHIAAAIRSVIPKEIQGYQFREATNEPWPNNPVPVHYRPPARVIFAKSTVTGEKKLLGSTQATASSLGIDKTTVKKRLLDQKPIGEWVLMEQ